MQKKHSEFVSGELGVGYGKNESAIYMESWEMFRK
jgi:hypothetical protein